MGAHRPEPHVPEPDEITGDEVVGQAATDHMAAAENWLAVAEQARTSIQALAPGDPDAFASNSLFTSAACLAREHREMAQAIWTHQRFAGFPARVAAPDWVTQPVPDGQGGWIDASAIPSPLDAVREAATADAREHEAQTIAPGVDPEPPEEGDLWTTGDGWFYYAVNGYPGSNRWLLVRHYAAFLRWQAEQGTKPMPGTWSEHGQPLFSWEEIGTAAAHASLRRPTADERTRFYGPEPDAPATDSQSLRVRAAVADIQERDRQREAAPEGPIKFAATVAAFSDEAVAEMARAVRREQAKRGLLGIEP